VKRSQEHVLVMKSHYCKSYYFSFRFDTPGAHALCFNLGLFVRVLCETHSAYSGCLHTEERGVILTITTQ
jgi:hypothetical protein